MLSGTTISTGIGVWSLKRSHRAQGWDGIDEGLDKKRSFFLGSESLVDHLSLHEDTDEWPCCFRVLDREESKEMVDFLELVVVDADITLSTR